MINRLKIKWMLFLQGIRIFILICFLLQCQKEEFYYYTDQYVYKNETLHNIKLVAHGTVIVDLENNKYYDDNQGAIHCKDTTLMTINPQRSDTIKVWSKGTVRNLDIETFKKYNINTWILGDSMTIFFDNNYCIKYVDSSLLSGIYYTPSIELRTPYYFVNYATEKISRNNFIHTYTFTDEDLKKAKPCN